MSVLIDTSVWVDHFRNHNAALVHLLHQDRVLTHPMVLLEIACGTPPAPRPQTLRNLSLLQSCPEASPFKPHPSARSSASTNSAATSQPVWSVIS